MQNPRSRLTSITSHSATPFSILDNELLLQPTSQIHNNTKQRKCKPAYHTQIRDVPRWSLLLIAIEQKTEGSSPPAQEWGRLEMKVGLRKPRGRCTFNSLTETQNMWDWANANSPRDPWSHLQTSKTRWGLWRRLAAMNDTFRDP